MIHDFYDVDPTTPFLQLTVSILIIIAIGITVYVWNIRHERWS